MTTFFFSAAGVVSLDGTVAGTFLGIARAAFLGAVTAAAGGVIGFLSCFAGFFAGAAFFLLESFLTDLAEIFFFCADLTALAAFLGPLDVAALITLAIFFFFSSSFFLFYLSKEVM